MVNPNTVTITGGAKLDAVFAKFPEKVRKKIGKKAARRAAKPVLQDARDGIAEISPDLVKLLNIKPLKVRDRTMVGVSVKTTKTAYSDEGSVLNPHWFEYGAPGHLAWGKASAPLAPRPFVRPAMDANKETVKQIFATEIRQIIEQTAAELRKN